MTTVTVKDERPTVEVTEEGATVEVGANPTGYPTLVGLTIGNPLRATSATTAAFGGDILLDNDGLHLLDTNASHDLIIAPGSDLTADRTLTLTTGDAARTITLSGNPTLADWFDQSVKQAASPTFAGLDLTEGNITNVGDIALDSLTSDGSTITIGGTPSIVLTDGTTVAVTLGNDAGDDFTIDTSAFVVEGDTGNVGIGTTGPSAQLETSSYAWLGGSGSTDIILSLHELAGQSAAIGFHDTDGVEYPIIGMAKGTNDLITGSANLDLVIKQRTAKDIIFGTNDTEQVRIDSSGNVGIGTTGPDSKLHIDQASTTAAIPVMTLDQADLSEQFMKFMTTIGVGNPIEAVGAKTLTTTHFIKIEIDGVGDRYIPVGTIA